MSVWNTVYSYSSIYQLFYYFPHEQPYTSCCPLLSYFEGIDIFLALKIIQVYHHLLSNYKHFSTFLTLKGVYEAYGISLSSQTIKVLKMDSAVQPPGLYVNYSVWTPYQMFRVQWCYFIKRYCRNNFKNPFLYFL